jgi:hypothetical protein
MATKKIKFVLSPTGAFKLGYSVGDVVSLDEAQADALIDAAYAVPVEKNKKDSDAGADAKAENPQT